MNDEVKYHIGFSEKDLDGIEVALLSGDPGRATKIAGASHDANQNKYLQLERRLSEGRGLNSYIACYPDGKRILSATSGMGSPSLSIVVNELAQVGIRQIIRVGLTGSIQDDVHEGSVVITRASLCRQGAANDIAPVDYPAAANPFVTVALVEAARKLGVDWHMGLTASVDTFYEGQERIDTTYNKHLLRSLDGVVEEFRNLNLLNFEMESGTLFKMANVYGLAAGCICAVANRRTRTEKILPDARVIAEDSAIRVALEAVHSFNAEYLQPKYRR
jgi:uridine phosphorylase